MKPSILVVDDDPQIRSPIRGLFEAKQVEVQEAGSCRQALECLRSYPHDAVVLDYLLPDGNALELLPRIRGIDPDLPVLVLTGHGTVDLAVRAIKAGADNFLTKPADLAALWVLAERMLGARRHRLEARAGRAGRGVDDRPNPFLGRSAAIRRLQDEAERLLHVERAVLMVGETGSGKGVLARWLHDNGPRGSGTLVDINCASLSKELLESELFGHEKGAFTGAVAAKKGLLEVAHKGTLLLDEIGELDPGIQPKLLTVLEDLRFRRLGDVRDRHVDVRLIAATHRDLGVMVSDGTFRSDLFFRISALPLRVPPLRERPEDIDVLADNLLAVIGRELGRTGLALSPEARVRLRSYNWPGNIRELGNVLERAVLLGDADTLEARDFSFDDEMADAVVDSLDLTLEEVEISHIKRVLRAEAGHVMRAAKRLGVPRSSLYQKLKRYGIAVSRS